MLVVALLSPFGVIQNLSMAEMTTKILCGNDLLARFEDLLKNHTDVDIATAWATGGKHLRELAKAANRKRAAVKVRAIVGIALNATHPDALDELSSITAGNLKIVMNGSHLFHPKLYLFGRHKDGIVTRQALIGSANFTNAGFGGHSTANEEIMLEVCPGEQADALASWFRQRWDECPTDRPVSEVLAQYREEWKQRPPDRSAQLIVSGPVSSPRELLGDARPPQNIEEYRQALKKCEGALKGEGWEIFNPRGHSYMRVISRRKELLLGAASWSQLDRESQRQLTGGKHGTDGDWWGLMGRLRPGRLPVLVRHENQIRASLNRVVEASATDFPDVAVTAMQELTAIRHVGYGSATLLLTLARPDRLLSLNAASAKGLGALSGQSYSTLGRPENYRKLLQWLYKQPWYEGGEPEDEDLAAIWRVRAALVDSFVYERP